jgi:hypothetical protein
MGLLLRFGTWAEVLEGTCHANRIGLEVMITAPSQTCTDLNEQTRYCVDKKARFFNDGTLQKRSHPQK